VLARTNTSGSDGGNFHIDSYKASGDTAGNIYLNHFSDSNVYMTTGGGNVGIGIANINSNTKFHVHNPSTNNAIVKLTSIGTKTRSTNNTGTISYSNIDYDNGPN